MKLLDEFESINWSDLDRARETSTQLLRQLAADKAGLRQLLLSVEKDATRLQRCECHPLDDKIVIYDAMEERNFRIRFRLATAYQDERPHTHRFTFTTLILRGSYHQTWYHTSQDINQELDVDQVIPICIHEEQAGSAFTIHHNAIHSTIAPPDTISLIIRGPAVKHQAIITNKATKEISWRHGEKAESSERRKQVRMSLDRYKWWCQRLLEFGIV